MKKVISDAAFCAISAMQHYYTRKPSWRDSTIIPRWPSAAILDIIELQIAPFDPPITSWRATSVSRPGAAALIAGVVS